MHRLVRPDLDVYKPPLTLHLLRNTGKTPHQQLEIKMSDSSVSVTDNKKPEVQDERSVSMCLCGHLITLTCFAPIDSNIFSNRTLICWMLFISTQGWRKTDEEDDSWSEDGKVGKVKEKYNQQSKRLSVRHRMEVGERRDVRENNRGRCTEVGSSGWNIYPLHTECSNFQSVGSLSKSEMGSEWRHSSTHYLLLLAVGGEALGQQGTVLQQHFGDRLQKHDNTHIHIGGRGYSENFFRGESEHWHLHYGLIICLPVDLKAVSWKWSYRVIKRIVCLLGRMSQTQGFSLSESHVTSPGCPILIPASLNRSSMWGFASHVCLSRFSHIGQHLGERLPVIYNSHITYYPSCQGTSPHVAKGLRLQRDGSWCLMVKKSSPSQSYRGWNWMCWERQWSLKALSIMCSFIWQHVWGVRNNFLVFGLTFLPIIVLTCVWTLLTNSFSTSQFFFSLFKQSSALVAGSRKLFFFWAASKNTPCLNFHSLYQIWLCELANKGYLSHGCSVWHGINHVEQKFTAWFGSSGTKLPPRQVSSWVFTHNWCVIQNFLSWF